MASACFSKVLSNRIHGDPPRAFQNSIVMNYKVLLLSCPREQKCRGVTTCGVCLLSPKTATYVVMVRLALIKPQRIFLYGALSTSRKRMFKDCHVFLSCRPEYLNHCSCGDPAAFRTLQQTNHALPFPPSTNSSRTV